MNVDAPMNSEAMPVLSDRERKLGMLCHASALLGVMIPGAFLIEIVGPLAVWLVNRDESPFARDQGAESINFQITMTILYFCCYPLMLVLIGFPLLIAFKLMALALVIMASYKAHQGESYRYPFNLRFVGSGTGS